MQEEAEKDIITGRSTVSYSTLAQYEDYVVASITFEGVQFIWPTRQKPKGNRKWQEDLSKKYAGFVVGNLVHIEVRLSDATNFTIDLIVAERNFSQESKKTKFARDNLIGNPRVKQMLCLMQKNCAKRLTED